MIKKTARIVFLPCTCNEGMSSEVNFKRIDFMICQDSLFYGLL